MAHPRRHREAQVTSARHTPLQKCHQAPCRPDLGPEGQTHGGAVTHACRAEA